MAKSFAYASDYDTAYTLARLLVPIPVFGKPASQMVSDDANARGEGSSASSAHRGGRPKWTLAPAHHACSARDARAGRSLRRRACAPARRQKLDTSDWQSNGPKRLVGKPTPFVLPFIQ